MKNINPHFIFNIMVEINETHPIYNDMAWELLHGHKKS
jgi:LytS/YehU family sensor histidine kinase